MHEGLIFAIIWILSGLLGTVLTAWRFRLAYRYNSFWEHFEGLFLLTFCGPIAILLGVFLPLRRD